MSKKTPRAHQVKGMQMLRAEYVKGNKWTCVVMPTGAGKSALAAFVVDAHIEKDIKNKVLVVAHREELVEQLYDTMTVQGIRCGVIAANPTREVSPLRRVQIASIQTLVARDLHLDGITMFVYDECHHSLSEGWSVLALKYKATGAYGLGLTATPIRSDGLPLGDVFDALVQPVTVKELIKLGLLTDFDIRRPPSQLKKLQIAQRPVDAYKALAPGSKAIVFSSNVKTAKDQAKEFCDLGIQAEALDGKTPSGDRKAMLKRFKAGTTRVICNCGVLTEGFDDPECSTVILARNVGSIALYLQMVGRALRPHEKRGDAMIIDLCGSSWTHGTPADEREWTLDGEGIRKKKQEQAPERFCPSCGVLMDKDATECGECGKLGQAMLTPEVTGAKLVKYEGMRKKSPTERAKSLRKWMTEAEMAGHKIGKAFYKYKAVFGEYPPNDVIQAAKK